MKTVAIVGTHSGTRDLAPWNNQNIDIWVMNQSAQDTWVKRCSAVFQIHKPAVIQVNMYDPTHWDWMQEPHPYPIYMLEVDERVPSSVRYPLKEIQKELPCEPKMFSSSPSYCLALAAYLKYEKVLLYGMEMTWESEYGYQRESITYWVGFLQGRGIKVERHCADNIFVRPLYGMEMIWKQNPDKYSKRITVLNKQIRRMEAKAESWKDKNIVEWTKAITDLGVLHGRKVEAERYYKQFTEMVEKTGEAIMDTGEPERAIKEYSPQLQEARLRAQRALGAQDKKYYSELVMAMAILSGRVHENEDLKKEAPK